MKKICFVAFIVIMFKFCLNSQTVTFSHSGGFYDNSFNLELTCDEAYHIRYTTNGGTPTASSTLYTHPLALNESLYSKSDIYKIQATIDALLFIPDSVQKCITIRAGLFDIDENPVGEIVTNSYFIGTLIDTHGLSVISICADSLDLFDYNTGIFVPGVHFDPQNPDWTGNYYMRGDEWERLVNVEFYEYSNNSSINHLAGLRTHGGNARRISQKGLKLYARKEYGTKRFYHKFFNDIPNNSFKHLVLKPFSDFYVTTGIQDDICNKLARTIGVDALASRAIVVFINGEYWGIYYLRESPDSHYLEDHYGPEDTDYNVMGNWHGIIENGNNSDFMHMMSWLTNADLSIDENYEYLCSKIDVNEFINYYCLELYTANIDWPANNMRCWQYQNGPWRWIFYDGDGCLKGMDFDVMDNATTTEGSGWQTDPTSTLMFRKLLQNQTFCDSFLMRFEQLLESSFSYANMHNYYASSAQIVRNEISQQSRRFNNPLSLSQWEQEISSKIDNFIKGRCENMRNRLDDFFQYVDTNPYEITVYPNPTSGTIHVIIPNIDQNSETIVYDITGRIVYSQQNNRQDGDFTIDLNLQPGLYILRIGNITQKIIIQ